MQIYDKALANYLLATLMKNTDYLANITYPLNKEDFAPFKAHEIIYECISALAKNGVKTIALNDICLVLKNSPKKLKQLKEDIQDLKGYLVNLSEAGNEDSFLFYYGEVRKRSLLRDLQHKGFDISRFYNPNGDKETEDNRLRDITIQDILVYWKGVQSSLEQEYDIDETNENKKIGGSKSKDYLQKLRNGEIINIGESLESEYLTTLTDGIKKGDLIISSGDTSSGKSRRIIGNLCKLCATKKYNKNTDSWEENPSGGHKALYIGCEMKILEEVDPIFQAYVSDVESKNWKTRNIKKVDNKTFERMLYACDVLDESNIYGEYIPNFNTTKIEEKIKFYKQKYNIDYVGFDYILLNNALANEFGNMRNSGSARSDEILLELSSFLKDMARKYDVGILSATQVNADVKDYKMRDYSILRGGKAIADKVDCGIIAMPITNEEYNIVEDYIRQWSEKYNFGIMPNQEEIFVETVYKSRFSEYPKECKVFSITNLGTIRQTDMFVTTKNFKLLDIPKTKIM